MTCLVAQTVKSLHAVPETWVQYGFSPWVGKMIWRRKRQPTSVFLPGGSHGRRSLTGSTWGRKESDTTEQLHFTFLRVELQEYRGDADVLLEAYCERDMK